MVLKQPYTMTAFHRLVAQLEGWYQTGAISYANAVRHLVTGQATLNKHGHNPFAQDALTVHPFALVVACLFL